MANYVGYLVKVITRDNSSWEGTISYVDNSIMRLHNVLTNDLKKGIIPEATILSSDIKDLEVVSKHAHPVDHRQHHIPPPVISHPLPHQTIGHHQPNISHQPAPIQHHDPAIISMGHPPPPPPFELLKTNLIQPVYNNPPATSPRVTRAQDQSQQPPTGNGNNQNQNTPKKDRKGLSKSTNSMTQSNTSSPASKRKDDRKSNGHGTTFEPLTKNVFTEDFDFEGNNARFNKKQIFEEMASQSTPHEPIQPIHPSSIPSLIFQTEAGDEVPSVTASQMNNLYDAIDKLPIPLSQIVENIGRSLSQIALKMISGEEGKVIVLTGAGKKGAAGIACARHLANHNVNVFVCRSRAYQLTDEVMSQWKQYKTTNGKEAQLGSLPVEPVALIIDALIGIGLRPNISEPTSTLIGWANGNGSEILSLDMPSGVDPTTGKCHGLHITADATMAVGLPKTGLVESKAGALYLADMGVPTPLLTKLAPGYTSPFGEQFILRLNQT